MRKMMAAVVLWGAVAFAAGNTGATSKEGGEQGAKQFSQQMDKAWNGKDAKGLSDLFTDKATLISPFGDKGDGRAGVEKLFSRHMEQDLKGTTLRTEVGSVQTLSSDVAVADLTQHIQNFAGEKGKSKDIHFTAVLQNEGGTWKAAAGRAYIFQEQPKPGTGGSGSMDKMQKDQSKP